MSIPQHTLLDRKVVEDRIVDILETSLDTVQLMTIDNDLAQEAGMVKHINVQAVNEESLETAQVEIKELLRERHNLGKNKEDDF